MPVPFVTLRYHAQEICRTLVCRLNAFCGAMLLLRWAAMIWG
ncbi:MAG: hypothetical protein E7B35_10835 [Escherichia coli]|nr:hypothetical protein [Escherichia coli]